MTDQVAQVLLDLAGIKSRYYRPKNDLISPRFQAHKRTLLNNLCFDDYNTK